MKLKQYSFGNLILAMLISFLFTACSQKRHAAPGLEKVEAVQEVQQSRQCRLTGKVIFGPLRPVAKEGMPKPDAPKMYEGRFVVIYSEDPKRVVARLPLTGTGNYECSLAPGSYIVDMKLKIPERSSELPKHIQLKEGETVALNININTGMQ